MSKPTSYAEVARACDVTWCQGCPRGNHLTGWADMSNGTVHWSDRLLTRRGLRNFLKLVASIYHSHNRGQPTWVKLFEQNHWAYWRALELGVRLPRSASRLDRSRVRYLGRRYQISQEAKEWSSERG